MSWNKLALRAPLTALALALLTVFVTPSHAEAPKPVEGGYTLVVLPDTQLYSEKFETNYVAQTEWIAKNVDRYNMKYVLHVGDVTQNNIKREWEVALDAHKKMEGKVPCAVVPGNHDLGPGGKGSSRETLMSDYFKFQEFQKMPTFGGVYDKEPNRMENNYHLFEAGGRKWMILGLEFGPRNDVLRWANEVVAKHPDHTVILITHAYLRPDNNRFDRYLKFANGKNAGIDQYKLSQEPGGYNDGQDMWNKLVSKHKNFAMVFSGHVCFTGLLSTKGDHGNTVHQILVDYQRLPQGGSGYLRLVQFHPDGVTFEVQDYSPVHDAISGIPFTNYQLKLEPIGAE